MDAIVLNSVKKLQKQVAELTSTTQALGVPVLVDLAHSVIVPNSQTVRTALSTGFNKVDIRTLQAKNVTNSDTFLVRIFDKSVGGDAVYESILSNNVYDILSIPVVDRNNNSKIYVEIVNNTLNDITVDLKLMLVSLN